MDKGTLIGISAGLGLVLVSMLMGGGVTAFISIPSLLIVLGGTIAATLVNFPMKDLISVMKVTQKALKEEIMPSSK